MQHKAWMTLYDNITTPSHIVKNYDAAFADALFDDTRFPILFDLVRDCAAMYPQLFFIATTRHNALALFCRSQEFSDLWLDCGRKIASKRQLTTFDELRAYYCDSNVTTDENNPAANCP